MWSLKTAGRRVTVSPPRREGGRNGPRPLGIRPTPGIDEITGAPLVALLRVQNTFIALARQALTDI
jgi:hypothetical protein